MAVITGTAALLAAIPKWLWVLAAGLYGGHLGLQGLGAYGQYGLGKRQIAAGVEGQRIQAGMGRREEEKMNALVKQLLSMKKTEKRETRELETLRMLEAGRERESMTLMNLMQAMAGIGTQVAGAAGGSATPSSYLSLLR